MKMYKRTMALATTLLLPVILASCVDVTGTLTVNEKLSFKKRVLISTSSRVDVKPGQYNAKLEFGSTTATLKIRGLSDIPFKISNDLVRLDSRPGTQNFRLSSSRSRQPYDLDGQVDTYFHQSGNYHDQESCSETRRVYNGTIYESGYQDVDYHYNITDHNFSITILKNGADLGFYQGTHQAQDKEYSYRGRCVITSSRFVPDSDTRPTDPSHPVPPQPMPPRPLRG